MTEMLTKTDYEKIARHLKLPSAAIIDGEPYLAKSGDTFATTNPATGEVLVELTACSAADVDVAVASARAAWADGRWAKLHPSSRKQALLRLAALIEKNALELAVMRNIPHCCLP